MKKFKVGEKIGLVGGGGLLNEFEVVTFKGYKQGERGTQAIVKRKRWNKTEIFEPYVTDGVKPLPMAGSTWSLVKLKRELKDLPLGSYIICGKEIKDVTKMGLFGNILNAKTVKTLK